MNDPRHLTDDDVFAVLKAALDDVERVPGVAIEAAYAAVELDTLAEELAVLAFDSSAGMLVEMRSTEAEARLLSFVNDHLTVDLELHGDGQTIVGQASPPVDAPLQIEAEDGAIVDVPTDEFGRFRVIAPDGPIRLRVLGLLVTPWFTR